MLRDVLNTIVLLRDTIVLKHYTFYNGEHACWRGVCIVYEIHLFCVRSQCRQLRPAMEVVRLCFL
jgi:hypothetical protein